MIEALAPLTNRITLAAIPFTERNSRLLVFREGDAFQIKLAESWSEDRALTFVTWYFLDEHGEILVPAITTFAHCVEIETRIGHFTLTFADPETLLLELPPQVCGLRLLTVGDSFQQDRLGATIAYHDILPLHLSYTTSATITHHQIDQIEPAALQHDLQLDASAEGRSFALHVTRTARRNRYLPQMNALLANNRQQWETWFADVPEVAQPYRDPFAFAWWVMRVNLIRSYSYPHHEGMIPSRVGYVGIWNWDSYFHAIALRHHTPALAQDQFRILFDHQLENGMLPDVVQDTGALTYTTDYGIAAAITKPPLTAWAIWKVYETSRDRAFLHETYERLVQSHRWWFQDLNADGFPEYSHPYSSGLDNSPLFDGGLLETPDLTAYLILQADTLAQIAAEIGLESDHQQWLAQADQLTQQLIALRWDEASGLFQARRNGQPVPIRTPLGMMPLLTGRLPASIATRIVATLTDPAQFWSHFPVPTVALDDPYHDPLTMWRGPVWVNINYLLIEGLQRSGFPQLARELRRKTLEMVMQHRDIYEYYHPQTGEKPPRAVSVFGWSSALFIDLVLQELSD